MRCSKRDLPTSVPLLRLVDVGMGAKIAEYVCFALARITRGLERFGPGGTRDWNADRPRGRPPTVGVLGAGAIGGKIADAAALFEYDVRTWTRTPRSGRRARNFVGPDELDAFLGGTDVLVNALPLTRGHGEPARSRSPVAPAGGRPSDQRRARRGDRRRGPDCAAGQRAHRERHARRVSHRAAAGRSPVLASPQGDGHAAPVGADAARTRRRADRGAVAATRGRRAGRGFAGYVDRARGY